MCLETETRPRGRRYDNPVPSPILTTCLHLPLQHFEYLFGPPPVQGFSVFLKRFGYIGANSEIEITLPGFIQEHSCLGSSGMV